MPHYPFKYEPGIFEYEKIYIHKVAWREFRKAFAQMCWSDQGFLLMDQFEQACKRIGHNTPRLLIEVAIFEFLEKTDEERQAGYYRLSDLHNRRDHKDRVQEEYHAKLSYRDSTPDDNNRQRLDLQFDDNGKLTHVTAQRHFYGSGFAMTSQIKKQLAERERQRVQNNEFNAAMKQIGFNTEAK